jgi:hypothetical protein
VALKPHGYRRNITWTTNISFVVEACTDLASSSWVALQSFNVTNGTAYFSDPNWVSFPSRLYRIRSP